MLKAGSLSASAPLSSQQFPRMFNGGIVRLIWQHLQEYMAFLSKLRGFLQNLLSSTHFFRRISQFDELIGHFCWRILGIHWLVSLQFTGWFNRKNTTRMPSLVVKTSQNGRYMAGVYHVNSRNSSPTNHHHDGLVWALGSLGLIMMDMMDISWYVHRIPPHTHSNKYKQIPMYVCMYVCIYIHI